METKDMSAGAAIGVAFTALIAVGFVVPVFADPNYGGWVKFLETYQTFLGGILAVVAAYITVHHMAMSDAKTERRHLQQMQLALRSENRRVERALYPQAMDLQSAADELSRIYKTLEEPPVEHWFGVIHFELHELKVALFHAKEVFDRSQFAEGQDLLDGFTSWLTDLAKAAVNEAWELAENFPLSTTIWGGNVDQDEMRTQAAAKLGYQVQAVVSMLGDLCPRLEVSLNEARSALAMK